MNSMLHIISWLLAAFVILAVFTGCTAAGEITAQDDDAELDSLYAVNQQMAEDLSVLRDSVQFYSDIETGRYYRQIRVLEDEIQRLTYSIEVCRDGGNTIEMLEVDQLFEPASASLTTDGREQLAVVADSLIARYTGDVIRIEAHSDSTPVGGTLAERYPSNWELSAARAAEIVRYLVAEHDLPTGQVEVVSYGSTRPVARNDSAAGREENRRIRIAVVTR